MNRLFRNRDKKIAILLAAAFAWLFIGSLVIFHEEHVLDKHFNPNIQAFISPKSTDKQGSAIKLHHSLLKLFDDAQTAGTLSQNLHAVYNSCVFEIKPKATSSFYQDLEILDNFPLRAPPAV